MPWEEKSIMQQREEFVILASREGANLRELCRRFQISHTTGYKWRRRHSEGGAVGLADQSRRPLHTPGRSAAEIEAQILAARQTPPKWGARKLKRLAGGSGGARIAGGEHGARDFAAAWSDQPLR
jgi:transposase-like protein